VAMDRGVSHELGLVIWCFPLTTNQSPAESTASTGELAGGQTSSPNTRSIVLPCLGCLFLSTMCPSLFSALKASQVHVLRLLRTHVGPVPMSWALCLHHAYHTN